VAIEILAVDEGNCAFVGWLCNVGHSKPKMITPPGPFGMSGGELVHI
jgi:hypothetical protein